MKKIILSGVFLLFLCIYAYNQTYTSVVIYTPSNIAVNALSLTSSDLTAQQKTDSKNFWLSCYNNRITYANEATYKYNCHGYAWNVSSGGAEVWINTPEQKKYWQCGGSGCGGYIEVSAADATKVSFGGPCNGYKTTCAGTSYSDWCDHSAITTTTSGRFKSKWGSAPVFEHDIADCPYTSSDLHYYALPVISGAGLLCYTSSYTYSVQNFVGVTYSWTTSSHLQINGSNTGRTVSVSPTSSSKTEEWIKVEIYITAYDKTIETTKSVWVGAPVLSITGPSTGCVNNTYDFAASPTVPFYSAYNYTWSLTPLTGNYLYPYGSDNSYCAIEFHRVSGHRVMVRAQNSCGTGTDAYKIVSINQCFSFSLSPNPASETVTVTKKGSGAADGIDNAAISEDAATVYTIRLIDYYGALHYTATRSGDSFTFPVSGLKDGQYFIQISEGKNTTSLPLIVKH